MTMLTPQKNLTPSSSQREIGTIQVGYYRAQSPCRRRMASKGPRPRGLLGRLVNARKGSKMTSMTSYQ